MKILILINLILVGINLGLCFLGVPNVLMILSWIICILWIINYYMIYSVYEKIKQKE